MSDLAPLPYVLQTLITNSTGTTISFALPEAATTSYTLVYPQTNDIGYLFNDGLGNLNWFASASSGFNDGLSTSPGAFFLSDATTGLYLTSGVLGMSVGAKSLFTVSAPEYTHTLYDEAEAPTYTTSILTRDVYNTGVLYHQVSDDTQLYNTFTTIRFTSYLYSKPILELARHTVTIGDPTDKVALAVTGDVSLASGLDMTSTAHTFRLPRLTTLQRNSIVALDGSLLYNTTTQTAELYSNAQWATIPIFDQSLNTTDLPTFAQVTTPNVSTQQVTFTGGVGVNKIDLPANTSDAFSITSNLVDYIRINTSDTTGLIALLQNTTITGSLVISTTTGGVKFPTLTSLQRDALTPAIGLTIYNTTLGRLEVYHGDWDTIAMSDQELFTYDPATFAQLTIDQIQLDNSTLTYSGVSGTNLITIPNNVLDALTITTGTADLMRLVTSTNVREVQLLQNVTITGGLTINSTTHALVVPRMTTAQVNALPPTDGSIVFNTSVGYMQAFNGAWVSLASYDQSLNTTDVVTFAGLTVDDIAINNGTITMSGNNATNCILVPHNLPDAMNIVSTDGLVQTEYLRIQSSVGTQTLHVYSNAIFHGELRINTSSNALVLSVLTDVERAAIELHAGTLIYNTDHEELQFYGTAWHSVATFDQSLNTTDSPTFTGLTIGNIALSGGQITFSGATGGNVISVPHNVANAYTISSNAGATSYVRITSTTGAPRVTLLQNTTISGELNLNTVTKALILPRLTALQIISVPTIAGSLIYNVTLGQIQLYTNEWKTVEFYDQALNTTDSPIFAGLTIDQLQLNDSTLTFSGLTTDNFISIGDNLTDALTISAGATALMRFVTTTGSKRIQILQDVTLTGELLISTATKALVLPRLTSGQMASVPTVNGSLIFNTTTSTLHVYAGTWVSLVAYNQSLNTTDSPTFAQLTIDQLQLDASTVTFSGSTTTNIISLVDNLADALTISTGATALMRFVTTTGSKHIYLLQDVHASGEITMLSTSKALILTRVTDAQRASIPTTAGSIIYNTTSSTLQVYTGTWDSLVSYDQSLNTTDSPSFQQLTVDLISLSGSSITFNGLSGSNILNLPSNFADAFTIKTATANLIRLVTTTGALKIQLLQDTTLSGELNMTTVSHALVLPRLTTVQLNNVPSVAGSLVYNTTTSTLNVYTSTWMSLPFYDQSLNTTDSPTFTQLTIDQLQLYDSTVAFNGVTGANTILVVDNLADALTIMAGANALMRFVTTTASRRIHLLQNTTLTGELDMTTTNHALILPRLTSLQILALTPTGGSIVYNTTSKALNIYTTTWNSLALYDQLLNTTDAVSFAQVTVGQLQLNDSTVTFSGATTTNVISIVDNLADALTITAGANALMRFVTTTASRRIYLLQDTTLTGELNMTTTNHALILPRLTALQIAGVTPIAGSIVYNTTNSVISVYTDDWNTLALYDQPLNTTDAVTFAQVTVDQLQLNASTITFSGATGANVISIVDNEADALTITAGANALMRFVTTTATRRIQLLQDVTMSGDLNMTTTTKALILPRLTTVQIGSVPTTAGSIVYNTTTSTLNVYTSAWTSIPFYDQLLNTTNTVTFAQVTVDQLQLNASTITFSGVTGANVISIVDNEADALTITAGANALMKFVTTTATRRIQLLQDVTMSGDLNMTTTTKALILPRLTTVQIGSVPTTAGSLLYNTTTSTLNVYTSTWSTVVTSNQSLYTTDAVTFAQVTADQLQLNDSTVTFSGATGANVISVVDNLADALTITAGANAIMRFVTTTATRRIQLLQDVTMSGDLNMTTTTKALILPRLTTVQIGSVPTTAGSLLYNTTDSCLQFYASSWQQMKIYDTQTLTNNGYLPTTNHQEVTGASTGGVISINGSNNARIDITAGSAVFIDYSNPAAVTRTIITWTSQTALDPGMSAFTVWVGVKNNGGVAQFVYYLEPSTTNFRDTAILGRIWSNVGNIATQITNVGYYKRPTYQLTASFRDFITKIGSTNLQGNVFSIASLLTLNKSSGLSYRYWTNTSGADDIGTENVHNDGALTPVTLYGYHLQGIKTLEQLASINPNHYDLNGVKTAVTTGYWTIQEVWWYPLSQVVSILYGQRMYANKPSALIGVSTEYKVRNTDILQGSAFRAYLIVQQGMTSLSSAILIEQSTINQPMATSGVHQQYVTRTYALSDYGNSATVYLGGYYVAPAASRTLTAGGSATYGTVNYAYGANAFVVASGAGGVASLTISGNSISDAGVVAPDSEVLIANCSLATTNAYYQTTKRWVGQITQTLTGAGTFTFNYGFADYDNMNGRDFNVCDFAVQGRTQGGMLANQFEFTLLTHKSTGWTYSAAAFSPGSSEVICSTATDYAGVYNLNLNNSHFTYKRNNLDTRISSGSTIEGVLVKCVFGINAGMRYATVNIGVIL